MDSKRGTLSVEEIVKLILGLAVFIFILFILFGVYNIVSGSLKQQQAKNTLDNIVYEIGKMQVDDVKGVLIESPKGWSIMKEANELCICEKISGISCAGARVCSPVDAYVSSSCSLVGTLGVTGGVSCAYLDSFPYTIYLTKEYGGRVEIDSNSPNLNDLSSSKFKQYLRNLNNDEMFRSLVINYISTKSESDKKILVDYISNLEFIKSANTENRYWRLKYNSLNTESENVYQKDFGTGSKEWVDHSDLAGVYVGKDFYNLNIDLFYIEPNRLASGEQKIVQNTIEYAEMTRLNGIYSVSKKDCYGVGEKYCILVYEDSFNYYFQTNSFKNKESYTLFKRNTIFSDSASCTITVGESILISACPVFQDITEAHSFILNEDGSFSFKEMKTLVS